MKGWEFKHLALLKQKTLPGRIRLSHLALLCENLFKVQPSFSPHVAVGDVSQL